MTEEALERRRAYYRSYMKSHPELRTKWREKNREHVNAYSKQWYAEHPGKRKEYAARYWQKKVEGGDHNAE